MPPTSPLTTARCHGDHCDVTVTMAQVRRGLTSSCGRPDCGPEPERSEHDTRAEERGER